MNTQHPWKVFYSYSHKDEELRQRLGVFMAPLVQQKMIEEWHDRKIEPGGNWNNEINDQLDSAHLILLLLSADFLASEYCYSIEVRKAFDRMQRGEAKVVPILLSSCYWQKSPFSELQMIPRDAKPIINTSALTIEAALTGVVEEISKLVSGPPPRPKPDSLILDPSQFNSSLDLVRNQVRAYAQLYERTRQRMSAGNVRTQRMEQIFQMMCNVATASYPLLDELIKSRSPGERLAAVSILQIFSSDQHLQFLTDLIGAEKPFVGFQAAKALYFAAEKFDPKYYPQLLQAINGAKSKLEKASVGFDTDRYTLLLKAEAAIYETKEVLTTSQ